MGNAHTSRYICGRRAQVPPALVTAVLNLANAEAPHGHPYTAEDVFTSLLCTIQEHAGSVHHGVALNLLGTEAGTIWALWRDGAEPATAVSLPDCPATTDDDACSEFLGHPGAHSWDLTDPPQPEFPFPLPPPT